MFERRTTEEDRERERENRNGCCGRAAWPRSTRCSVGVTGKRGRRAARWQRRRRRAAEDVPVSRRPGRCTRHQSPAEAVVASVPRRAHRDQVSISRSRASGIRNSLPREKRNRPPRSGAECERNNQETRDLPSSSYYIFLRCYNRQKFGKKFCSFSDFSVERSFIDRFIFLLVFV